MLLLLTIIFCWATYKFFTKWVWILIPIVLVVSAGSWLIHHPSAVVLIVAIIAGIYDLIYRHYHNGQDPFLKQTK